jgi:ParB-like chromosome segregation protein Spo0J
MENLTSGNVKAAMKEAGAVSADLWQVAPDRLRVLPGFNVRVQNDAYNERVRWIANSIKENGYYKDKPLSGYVAREEDGEVIYITGGHRRLEAVGVAILEGANVPVVPVIISPKGTSVEDLNVALIMGNDGDPLTLYECAVVCKRLARFGWSSADIAKRVGYVSAQYVDGLLDLVAAPLGVRSMVIEGKVSPTYAIEVLKAHGPKAAEVLQGMEVTAKAAGKTKVTKKFDPEAAFKQNVRKQAPAMFELLERIADTYELGPDDAKIIADLIAGVKS